MVGRDKGERGINQHDDPGSHKDCTRPNNLENDPEGAAVACLSTPVQLSRVKMLEKIVPV